jgi:hypothetical protein
VHLELLDLLGVHAVLPSSNRNAFSKAHILASRPTIRTRDGFDTDLCWIRRGFGQGVAGSPGAVVEVDVDDSSGAVVVVVVDGSAVVVVGLAVVVVVDGRVVGGGGAVVVVDVAGSRT